MENEGIDPKFLVRDRDGKYPNAFDAFWKEADVRPIKIPPRAPMANAFSRELHRNYKAGSVESLHLLQ